MSVINESLGSENHENSVGQCRAVKTVFAEYREYPGNESATMCLHDLEQTALVVGLPAMLAPHKVGSSSSRNPSTK